jgi:Protein of unknown function (DUF3800)
MLTIYIDDSGTGPSQNIAVAAGWIAKMPAWRLFEREWNRVRSVESHKFNCMHMADFVAGYKEFKNWGDLDEKLSLMKNLRQVIKKRAIKGFGLGVIKKDFDELVPPALKAKGYESHYTYAVRRVLGMIHDWRKSQRIEDQPIEYIFDYMDAHDPRRREIEDVFNSVGTPEENFLSYGLFDGGFSFRPKKSLSPLQAADILAWTAYQTVLNEIEKNKLHPIAKENFKDFYLHRHRRFLEGGYHKRDHILDWVKKKGF